MKLHDFPNDIKPFLLPELKGSFIYKCLGCGRQHSIDELLYTCPDCRQVLLLQDLDFDRLKAISGTLWHRIFDYRKMLNIPALQGIYRYHEFIGPMIPVDDIVYLGEGHTPMVAANAFLAEEAGGAFYFKNDGQNPSASFKDRGLASALSYLNSLCGREGFQMYSLCAHLPEILPLPPPFTDPISNRISSRLCCCPTRKLHRSSFHSPWEAVPLFLKYRACSMTA